jgi:hypothetical protein
MASFIPSQLLLGSSRGGHQPTHPPETLETLEARLEAWATFQVAKIDCMKLSKSVWLVLWLDWWVLAQSRNRHGA